MEVAEIEALTREVLPALRETPLVRTVIERSGSSRRFVKLRPAEGAAGTGVVAMHYTLDRPENGRFGAITDFLRGLGVPVPAIRHRDEGRQVIWLEDLGTEDLAAHATDDWDTVRRPLYAAALRAVFPLHRVAETSPPPDLPALEKPFDAALYRWEQDYFFARFAPHFSALDAAACEAVRQSPELAALAESLGKAPRRLIHRDFQSSNVMLRAGAPVFIDYQGMRWGLEEYDLASLLFDP
ncbi:MAG: phosphotransferase, partial [Verrucomicrobiae bacterium]|nr:phosphotransferase [Verrucomicrobiae bacterium]